MPQQPVNVDATRVVTALRDALATAHFDLAVATARAEEAEAKLAAQADADPA